MRSSLSCQSCRRSKVKCINEGRPPCQRCDKSEIPGCELSRPPRHAFAKGGRSSLRDGPPARPSEYNQPSTLPRQSGQSMTESARAPLYPELVPVAAQHDNVDKHLSAWPLAAVLESANIFIHKFPELGMLQTSLLKRCFDCHRSVEDKALLAGILGIITRQCPKLQTIQGHKLLTSDRYISYARDVLPQCIFEPPKVQVVQSLLILALYEWGVRDFHKAWMHCGIAIRIMQSLHSSRIAPYPLDISSANDQNTSIGVETKTYWACFIMDCTINSGIYSPRTLQMSNMRKLKVPRPPTTTEFTFESGTVTQQTAEDQVETPRSLDLNDIYEIMTQGFDVYAQAMAFMLNNGRRAPGMCAIKNCPWVPGSPWQTCRSRLDQWRRSQDARLHYPRNSIVAHMAVGSSESFVYINLLYYQSVMILHREYIPFLPTTKSTPVGPIDPPFLEAEAPPSWWEDNARQLFDASEQVATLLHDAIECGAPVLTPLSGFCAFSACYLNLYVARFPRINLNRSPKAAELMRWGLEYLKEFQSIWTLGDAWLKTIHNSSLLYERATSGDQRYLGRTRTDFDTLHQSIHEFRVVDRSEQHMQELNRAHGTPNNPIEILQRASTNGTEEGHLGSFDVLPSGALDTINVNCEEIWPNWWSSIEEAGISGAFVSTWINQDNFSPTPAD